MTPPAAASAAHRGRVGAPARPLTPRPRRVSGPARPPSRPRTPPAAPREQGLANGLLAGAEGLLHARSLDRLIRGRGWIAVIAFALIGIVTLQLGLLKLNAGMGRSIERAEALQRKNAALSIENSELAAGGGSRRSRPAWEWWSSPPEHSATFARAPPGRPRAQPRQP